MCPFVEGFLDVPHQPDSRTPTPLSAPLRQVPRVATSLTLRDHAGTVLTRMGITRNNYIVTAGLYAAGTPDHSSPVIVTANYKLTFDAVRKHLAGQNVWLLILDTRGINVWCAAGKSLFSTEEVVRRVQAVGLDSIVSHRKLILPQLAAPGVCAGDVRKRSGFSVVYSTCRAEDLPQFLTSNMQATEAMRTVTFSLRDRAVLIPVDILTAIRTLLPAAAIAFCLGLISPDGFSFTAALQRLPAFILSSLLAIFGGLVLVPLFLPYIPPRMFFKKGAITGVLCGLMLPLLLSQSNLWGMPQLADYPALMLWCVTGSSFLAMNFTGSTPFTSASGVIAEMTKAIPLLACGAAASALLWLAAPFI